MVFRARFTCLGHLLIGEWLHSPLCLWYDKSISLIKGSVFAIDRALS